MAFSTSAEVIFSPLTEANSSAAFSLSSLAETKASVKMSWIMIKKLILSDDIGDR